MSPKAGHTRHKHIPMRTCIVCRQSQAKRELVRVVRTPEGPVLVDPTGKRAGRGAYLCRNVRCWQEALRRGSVEHALKTTLSAEDREHLREFMATLGAGEAEGETVERA